MTTSATTTKPAVTTYAQSFNSGSIGRWTNRYKQVVLSNDSGRLRIQSDSMLMRDFYLIDLNAPLVTDGILEATITPNHIGASIGFLFRYESETSYNGYGMDNGTWEWMGATGQYGEFNELDASLPKDAPSKLRIEFRGIQFKVILNGKTIISHTNAFLSSGSGGGRIGLYGYVDPEREFLVDDIRLTKIK